MPHTYTRTFRVRQYECDAYGHLNNANYLRFMQETAVDASADAGFDMARYHQMQRVWLIRESLVDFLCPVYYNERIDIRTYVADIQRMGSRRAYEFSRDGQAIASGWSNWVYIDTQSMRPTRIGDDIAQGFFPEGLPDQFPAFPAFSTPPPPPAGAFVMSRQVAWQDIDIMQHLNNAMYLTYASDCGFAATAAFGWPFERLQAEGIGIYLRRLHVQYRQPAQCNDDLTITSWVSDVRRSTAWRHYNIQRSHDGALLAQINTYSVWVGLESGQPVRIPKQMLLDFAPNIARK